MQPFDPPVVNKFGEFGQLLGHVAAMQESKVNVLKKLQKHKKEKHAEFHGGVVTRMGRTPLKHHCNAACELRVCQTGRALNQGKLGGRRSGGTFWGRGVIQRLWLCDLVWLIQVRGWANRAATR